MSGAARNPMHPAVATIKESGVADLDLESWFGLFAPAKTPPEIVARLEKTALEILNKPEMKERLTKAGFEVTARDGKGHMARVEKEVPMFRQIIEQANIKKL